MFTLKNLGYEILNETHRSVLVGGVIRYRAVDGKRITAISVISPVPFSDSLYEALTIGPDREIVYTNAFPYCGDVARFDNFPDLERHLRYATGRGATPVADDESSESDEEDEVEIAETGESAAAPPPPPEVVVETAETGETAAAPPPPPTDTGTPVPPLPPAVSGTPVPPIPPEMGIMELGAQLVELFQDKGPMMTESETKALGALMELMKTLGTECDV